MHTRATSAFVLAIGLVMSPILLAAEKEKSPAPAASAGQVSKDDSKKETAAPSTAAKPAPAKQQAGKQNAKAATKQEAAKPDSKKSSSRRSIFSSSSKEPAKARGGAWADNKGGTTPAVRSIPYQPPANQSMTRAASTRPADQFIFKAAPRYDYFRDHYGTGSGNPDIVGYVAPEGGGITRPLASSSNRDNPFVYRRAQ